MLAVQPGGSHRGEEKLHTQWITCKKLHGRKARAETRSNLPGSHLCLAHCLPLKELNANDNKDGRMRCCCIREAMIPRPLLTSRTGVGHFQAASFILCNNDSEGETMQVHLLRHGHWSFSTHQKQTRILTFSLCHRLSLQARIRVRNCIRIVSEIIRQHTNLCLRLES